MVPTGLILQLCAVPAMHANYGLIIFVTSVNRLHMCVSCIGKDDRLRCCELLVDVDNGEGDIRD